MQVYRTIPINEIIVENRRREDYGDVEGLAESIRRLGLFHPIVVDDKNNLVAGERRLRACKLLGWTEMPVRSYADLTDDERNEIELEENLKRKDLTSYEQSKQIVRLAEITAKTIEEKTTPSIIGHDVQKSNGNGAGRKPTYEVPKQEIANAIGKNEKTIRRAEQHVEAVQKYPELKLIPTQKDALTIAKNLDALPEDEREESREKLKQNDSETLTTLAEKPPMREREFAVGESPGEKWTKTLYKNQQFLTGIVHNGGLESLVRNWTGQERRYFYQRVCEIAQNFADIREQMEGILNETKQYERQNVA